MTENPLYDLDDDFFTLASHEDHDQYMDGWKPRLKIFEEIPPLNFESLSSFDCAP